MGDVSELHTAIARAMRAVPEPAIVEAHDEAETRRLRAERLDRSGCKVPDDVRDAIIAGDVEHRHATQALVAWFSDPKRAATLVISGTTGCGKTIALGTLAALRQTRYLRADDVCRIFSANFGEQLAKQDLVRETPYLLALDDVGTELDQARMLPTLLEILDSRASAVNTPTVIATNLTKKAFAERYANERLMSRMAKVRWESIQGEDLRRRK